MLSSSYLYVLDDLVALLELLQDLDCDLLHWLDVEELVVDQMVEVDLEGRVFLRVFSVEVFPADFVAVPE